MCIRDSLSAAQEDFDQRAASDTEFYNQLLGSGKEQFGRRFDQLGAVADAQNLQDQLALEGDMRRFETQQSDLGQRFDQSRLANLDALDREEMLFNQLGSLIDIGYGGAGGLTGNMNTFGTLGANALSERGDARAYEALQNKDLFAPAAGNILGGLFNRIGGKT